MATELSFEGEIFEIFSWLPAKSLYRLSTVSKLCNEYISEAYFIQKQCDNSCKKKEECLIIQNDNKLLFSFLPETHSLSGIPPKSFKFLSQNGRILASSNGLLLCRTVNSRKPTKLFLCNPSTRKYLPIKLPTEKLAKDLQCHGDVNVVLVCGNTFGRINHEFTLDYSLLIFAPTDSDDGWGSGFDVYSLEEGTWVLKNKNILGRGRNLNFDDQVCCRNGIYILSDSGDYLAFKSPYYWPYVCHYDVDNGSTKILVLPCEACENFYCLSCRFRLFGWERQEDNSWFDSLCLVKYLGSLITIWVLDIRNKDTILDCSWYKLLSINIVDDLGIKECASWTDSFTIMGKNIFFANADGNIYRYCLVGKDSGKLDMVCNYGYSTSKRLRFTSYSTTLRPCSKGPNLYSRKIK